MRSIKNLPVSLRPREKLLKSGPTLLSIEELLSVILITGTRNFSVTQIAKKINLAFRKSKTLNRDELIKMGLGKSKTSQILASLELGKRISGLSKVRLTTAAEIVTLFRETIKDHQESLVCFYLGVQGELLRKEVVAVGVSNRANVAPIDIFYLIKELPVYGVVLVHNHPSGILEPSEMDIRFTKRIKVAGEILGIKLLDHLIVTSDGWKRMKI